MAFGTPLCLLSLGVVPSVPGHTRLGKGREDGKTTVEGFEGDKDGSVRSLRFENGTQT